jgi:hypothetical protein
LTYSFMADQYREMGDLRLASQWYRAALNERPTDLRTRLKLALVASGLLGRGARALASDVRPANRLDGTSR